MSNMLVRRPMFGGTKNGLHPRRYLYWRVGYGATEDYNLDFHVERAGEFHCKSNFETNLVDYPSAVQVYYQIDGKAGLSYGAERLIVNPGDLFIIPAGYPFTYRSPRNLRFHWFCLAEGWPEVFGRRPSITVYPLGIDKIIQTYFAEIRESLIMQRRGYPLHALGVFYSLVARISDLTAPVELPHSSYPDTVRSALVYLRDNYVKPYDAEEVAKAVGVSQSHLRALFIKWVGEPPQRFHCRCKIYEAKRLIDQRLSITQTAHEVGYNDVRYFSRTFKHITGMTPTYYRDSNR